MAMAIPVAGMLLGLVLAIVVTYRKPREYADIPTQFTSEAAATEEDADQHSWQWKHSVTLLAIGVTLVLQIVFQSLVIAALGGFFLASFHLRGRPGPKPVVALHALLAVTGVGLLASAVLG